MRKPGCSRSCLSITSRSSPSPCIRAYAWGSYTAHQVWRDIDLPGATLTVTRPKSGKAETIPLNATARAILAGLERATSVVFPTLLKKLTDLFIRYAVKAKLEDLTFHCLRDTYISRLAAHVSTPTLMALARHRDYRTTRRWSG